MIETAKYIFTHYIVGAIAWYVIIKVIIKEVKRERRMQRQYIDPDEEDDD